MVPTDADVIGRATKLAASGHAVEGAAVLSEALANGSAAAAMELGFWRLSGQHIRRDLGLARDLFGQAAALGSREAEPIFLALLANGAGGSGRRWAEVLDRLGTHASTDPIAADQYQLLKAMALDEVGYPQSIAAGEAMRTDPDVRRFPAFLSAAECRYIMDRAQPILQPSVVVHPTTGQFIRDPIRSSTNAAFPFVSEDPVLHAINQRIAAATGTTYEQGEPLQVLSYEPGQQYKMHSDALAGDPNQRVVTFLVYLNDAYEGGETVFPDLDLSYRGGVGDGLMFRNVQADGTPHPLARHAGLPVTRGRKLLLSKWIRARALDLSGPPGRPL